MRRQSHTRTSFQRPFSGEPWLAGSPLIFLTLGLGADVLTGANQQKHTGFHRFSVHYNSWRVRVSATSVHKEQELRVFEHICFKAWDKSLFKRGDIHLYTAINDIFSSYRWYNLTLPVTPSRPRSSLCATLSPSASDIILISANFQKAIFNLADMNGDRLSGAHRRQD